MTNKAQEIQIDESGFLTPGKAITISTMSLFIWIVTGICYKALTFVAACVNYEAVTFFASLLLSCACGFYLVKKILKNASFATKIILGFANILLLYTSANGIQTGYCFISKPASGEVQQCSLIPFLIARPWLPDLYTKTEIDSLKEENKNLKAQNTEGLNTSEIESLQQENKKLREQISQTPGTAGYIKTIEGLTAENQRLIQELAKTKTADSMRIAELTDKINSGGNPGDKATISKLEKIIAQYSGLNKRLITLQQLRQNACIQRGEAAAFRMLNEMCGNDPASANQFKNIIANLRPVQ